MFSKIVKSVLVLSVLNAFQHVQAAEVHGSGAEGTVMGPVAFLWPEDRPWSANADNSGPCGSSAGITNRTEFPLGCKILPRYVNELETFPDFDYQPSDLSNSPSQAKPTT